MISSLADRVFAMSPEDIVKSAPSYWSVYLTEQNAPSDSQKKPGWPDPKTLQLAPNVGDTAAQRDLIFKVGEKGISAPRVLYQPEPEFTDLARKMHYQGTLGVSIVVDKSGNVRNVQMIRPLGMGLDENAVATIGTWRFAPAMLEGQPVAVAVYIEVGFHLER